MPRLIALGLCHQQFLSWISSQLAVAAVEGMTEEPEAAVEPGYRVQRLQ
jgi:hypothetical protein